MVQRTLSIPIEDMPKVWMRPMGWLWRCATITSWPRPKCSVGGRMEGLLGRQPRAGSQGLTGLLGASNFFFEKTETFFERFPLENAEAQASITVYLFSFNSGRVTRRVAFFFVLDFFGKLKPCSRGSVRDAEAQASMTVTCFHSTVGGSLDEVALLCCTKKGVVNQQGNQVLLPMPLASACWGMMLCALNPGTVLISITWGALPSSIIMSTRPCLRDEGHGTRPGPFVAGPACRVESIQQASLRDFRRRIWRRSRKTHCLK